jgi:hypothetical protein
MWGPLQGGDERALALAAPSPFGLAVMSSDRIWEPVGLGYHAGMSGARGGSAGPGHGSDPDEEALQRRVPYTFFRLRTPTTVL